MEMDVLPRTSEIVEPTEGLDFDLKIDKKAGKCYVPKLGRRYSIEDEINSLFEAIDIRTSGKGVGLPHESSKASLWKKAMKRPIRVGSSQLSGIGISEPVSLKQALRGLCISQASEMAAMKRLSRPAVTSGASEAGTIKRLDSTVIVEANGSGHPLSECNLVEKSLVPERITSDFSKKTCESSQKEKAELSHQNTYCSPYRVVPLHTGCSSEVAKNEVERFKSTDFSSTSHATKKLAEVDEKTAASIQVLGKAPVSEGKKTIFHTSSLSPNCRFGSTANIPARTPPQLMKLIFRKNIFVKRKLKPDLSPVSGISSHCGGRDNNDHDPSTSNSDVCEYTPDWKGGRFESFSGIQCHEL
ncbi:hypothetical protein MANES_11G159401v8 [Manihot esculenta]|uniref:Uncharacterized protein n=1 Tax=Manihot esculenta TaxID=3983 RepID=A0ACB7GYC0_MANES|nr:hypothetical protein MANES_11G159401v8 [Manihot esculenta]